MEQESNGNCFLYNSSYRDRDFENMIMLGKCEPVAAALVPPTKLDIDKMIEAMEDLGGMDGIVIVCSQSPHIDVETSLRWTGYSLDLSDLATEYAKRIWPNDASAQALAAVGVYGEAMLYQQEDPERIWDTPDACDEDMEDEVLRFIAAWRVRVAWLPP